MCRIVISAILSGDGGLDALFLSASSLARLNNQLTLDILLLVGSRVCSLIKLWFEVAKADLVKAISHPSILQTLCQVFIVCFLELVHALHDER